MTITEITATDFRCFRKAEAKLAPLTLLVGENSTGKTSFLALVRALLEAGYDARTPNFREPPYDLGTFRDIAHNRGARGSRAKEFSASFAAKPHGAEFSGSGHRFQVTFAEEASFASPSFREYSSGETVFRETAVECFLATSRGSWSWEITEEWAQIRRAEKFLPSFLLLHDLVTSNDDPGYGVLRHRRPEDLTNGPREEDQETAYKLLRSFANATGHPYCAAPVRSRPLRTYDPLKLASDPEGENIPTFLADLSLREPAKWEELHRAIESFGRAGGLFDELRVLRLARGGGPFQIQVRRHSQGKKGPWRNLIDVGYGVSQVLPLLTELCRPDGPWLFLLQQPEVHLYPSAQAALGSLLVQVAASGRQVLVETHSDHLMDRVRMDIRDRKTGLTPADASLLFFERGDLDARIHSLRFGENGEVLGAPPGYRQFFLDETERSITV